jgi:hypothetical protein
VKDNRLLEAKAQSAARLPLGVAEQNVHVVGEMGTVETHHLAQFPLAQRYVVAD